MNEARTSRRNGSPLMAVSSRSIFFRSGICGSDGMFEAAAASARASAASAAGSKNFIHFILTGRICHLTAFAARRLIAGVRRLAAETGRKPDEPDPHSAYHESRIMLEAKALCKRYGSITAVDGVSFR